MITFKNFILESQSADETVQRAVDETRKQYVLFDQSPFVKELCELLMQLNRTLQCQSIIFNPFSPIDNTTQCSITFKKPKKIDPQVLAFFERTAQTRVKKLFQDKVKIEVFLVFDNESRSWFDPADLVNFTYDTEPSFERITIMLKQK